jgi:hypothetical protein
MGNARMAALIYQKIQKAKIDMAQTTRAAANKAGGGREMSNAPVPQTPEF